tara:strand:- start:28241 stop:29317 length:1077 start_codon:yes stop_codon:yes gene_type:complete
MGFLKKIFKKIGKVVKKVFKGVGKFFKKVFKGVGKFVGKLGPIGMLGMMLLMPQLGAWWGKFGTWAGKLGGPMGKLMQGVAKVGNFIGKSYSTVTEGIGKVVGGFADAVGLGDAYRGATGWLNDKVRTLQGKLGLEQTPFPIEEIEVTAQKRGLPEDIIQEIEVTAQKRGIKTPSAKAPSIDEIKEIEVTAKHRGGWDEMTPTEQKAHIAEGRAEIMKSDPTRDWSKHGWEKTGWDKFTGKMQELYNTGKSWNETWQSVQGMAQELGLTEEEAMEYYGGTGYVAEPSVFLDNSINSANENAQIHWQDQGNAGIPAFGAGSYFAQQYNNALSEALSPNSNNPFWMFVADQARATQRPRW